MNPGPRAPGLPAFTLTLALRFLAARRINAMCVFGIAVAVWALIVVIAVFSGFIADIQGSLRRATPDLLVTALPTDASFADLDALVRSDPDVVATAPRLRQHAIYYPHQRDARYAAGGRGSARLMTRATDFDFVELIGVDPAREQQVTGFVDWLKIPDERFAVAAPGDALQVDNQVTAWWSARSGEGAPPGDPVGTSRAILLGEYRMLAGGIRYGQKLSVVTANFRRAKGDDGGTALETVRFHFHAGLPFESRDQVFDATRALVAIDELRDLLDYEIWDDPVSDVAVRVAPDADPETVKARLAAALADGGTAAEVLTWIEQNAVHLGAVEQERAMMKIVLFAVMLVAAFLVYATLHMMVTQKRRDIGILTAMGASPRGILQVFLATGGTVAVLGCALGTLGGCLSVQYMNPLDDWLRAEVGVSLFPRELYALDHIPYVLEPSWIAQVVLGALAISFFAAWLPARRAARMDPVRAIGYE